jgi:hypothetical protein
MKEYCSRQGLYKEKHETPLEGMFHRGYGEKVNLSLARAGGVGREFSYNLPRHHNDNNNQRLLFVKCRTASHSKILV